MVLVQYNEKTGYSVNIPAAIAKACGIQKGMDVDYIFMDDGRIEFKVNKKND